jgi:hypothetical protein
MRSQDRDRRRGFVKELLDCCEFVDFKPLKTSRYCYKTRRKVYQPLGLKRIFRHHFGQKIQSKGTIHTAKEDATAGMKIFKEAYVPWAKKT